MRILVDIIPAKWRKYVLWAPFALVGLVLGCWAIVEPGNEVIGTWLKVYSFVGSALGLTAYANTNLPPTNDVE